MLPTRITIVQFSDGDTPMYFIDGVRDQWMQDDSQLLDSLVGKQIAYVERIWIKPISEKRPGPWENISYVRDESELYQYLREHPQIEDRKEN